MILPAFVVFSMLGLLCTFLGQAQTFEKKCEEKYLMHYKAMGCTPVYERGSDFPSRYNCPQGKTEETPGVCLFNGKTYKVGDIIDVGDDCKKCSCGDMGINCAYVECPSGFGPRPDNVCYVYKANECCPQSQNCSIIESLPGCYFENKKYHYGERIYSDKDHCQICNCNENWNNDIYGKSCFTHNCALGLKKELLNGCIPIYHEATCCPMEFFCGSQEEGYRNTTVSLATKEDIDSGNTCAFKGMHYKRDQELDINHPTHCVTCYCITPPVFTCVQQSCPNPPDFGCEYVFEDGMCCPTFKCSTSTTPSG